MKLQLGELRPIINTLPKVLEKDLPGGKTSYWLARALVDITNEFKVFEEARKKLIEKHGRRYVKDKKDKDGKIIEKKGELITEIKKDNNGNELKDDNGNTLIGYIIEEQDAFDKDYNELADQGIDIKYEPRPIEDFITKDKEGKERNVLTGMDIVGLGRLIKEE